MGVVTFGVPGHKENLEQAWRPLIPVESFTDDRAEPVPVETPNVGIRWGKKATFEFSLDEEKELRENGFATVTTGPINLRINVEIFNEQFRFFNRGQIRVIHDPPTPGEGGLIDVEDLQSWLFPRGQAQLKDNRVVKFFYHWDTASQIAFDVSLGKGTRGEWPGS